MSNTSSFSIEAAIKIGWRKTIDNLWLVASAAFTIFAIAMVPSIIFDYVAGGSAWLVGLYNIIFIPVSAFLSLGFIKIALQLVRNQSARYEDLFSVRDWRIVSYIVAELIMAVLVAIGMLLLIVPGVIAAVALWLYNFIILDTNADPIDALKGSFRMTKGSWLSLLLFLILLAVINMVGALFFGIGLLVTVPLTAIASGHVYEQLRQGSEASAMNPRSPATSSDADDEDEVAEDEANEHDTKDTSREPDHDRKHAEEQDGGAVIKSDSSDDSKSATQDESEEHADDSHNAVEDGEDDDSNKQNS